MAERLFFSVPLSRISQLELIRLQARLGAEMSGPARVVPAANFHLTLAFLGSVSQQQKAALLARWESLVVPEVSLELDQLAYWHRAGVICATTSRTPMALGQLAHRMRQDAAEHGLHRSHAPFRPHVSLFRSVSQLSRELPAITPVPLHINEVDLMVSVFEPHGVEYHSVRRWGGAGSLSPGNEPR
ncbi:2'-5' RNA ligase [Ferrimonas balearica DSM 9799]|uniref:RNA 2',3'-cyclic phosphodiesterase n=1 Tax=Ferrimonas balearica (strain DSM 9799 / CCM 4581 / KCTC 23876 / PAT) TaxID=550540 RepID=E1SVV5_FERBD|nr:RNA 2',3'-cyclic phosphodiesterase [Ferrimonas balearica]ADN77406.1 2'-5' RNA ligase [Ferrimonas balearica DSM 9799]